MAVKTVRRSRHSLTKSQHGVKSRPRLVPGMEIDDSPFPLGPLGSTSGINDGFPIGSGSKGARGIHKAINDLAGQKAGMLRLFPKDYLIPVELTACFEQPVAGGPVAARCVLDRPISLIHSQDLAAAGCWYSRPLDLGDESGDPAYWTLERTPRDIWNLCLRRATGEVVSFRVKAKSPKFPIVLRKHDSTAEFGWPQTITIRCPN